VRVSYLALVQDKKSRAFYRQMHAVQFMSTAPPPRRFPCLVLLPVIDSIYLLHQDNDWGILIFLTTENLRCLRKCADVYIRVITKLPNSEQSNKGKVKTHKYINRKKSVNNRETVKTVMTLTWYMHF
jgi:hypothetical protein